MIVACVRTGKRYSFDYVLKLRNMVARFMPSTDYRFVCLTDQPDTHPLVEFVDISCTGLEGWWAKMLLFQSRWRRGHNVIYFDLDTVICDDLSPLVAVDSAFAICANFTRAAGNTAWPCKYGSCVMTLHRALGDLMWQAFDAQRSRLRGAFEAYGDQRVIEYLVPDADLLQDKLPPGYLISYRALSDVRPAGAAVINFGGRHKPDNCDIEWVRQAWQ